MRFPYLNFLFALALTAGITSTGQDATPTVKRTTAPATSLASGKDMFASY